MQKEIQKQIEEFIEVLKDPEDFQCYKAGVGVLCKAQDIGLETFLICLERNPQKCNFSVYFGNLFFCKSPLRVFIAKELKE